MKISKWMEIDPLEIDSYKMIVLLVQDFQKDRGEFT